ncbi:MAG: hypothetical protein ACRDMX_05830 [Solirubrobacteraceae bacterium]
MLVSTLLITGTGGVDFVVDNADRPVRDLAVDVVAGSTPNPSAARLR